MSITRIEDRFLNTTIKVYRPTNIKTARGGLTVTENLIYSGLKARIADTYKRRFVFGEKKEGINLVSFLVGAINPYMPDGTIAVFKENDRIFDYRTNILYKVVDARLILNKFGGIHKTKVNLEAIRKVDFVKQIRTITAKANVV